MLNNFKKLHEAREAMLPIELEHKVVHQVCTCSFFGRVFDLFVPNALQVVTKMIGGDGPAIPPTGRYADTDPALDWRRPPAGRRMPENGNFSDC
jgi:hypothetical protein